MSAHPSSGVGGTWKTIVFLLAAVTAVPTLSQTGIPLTFELQRPSFVTLVIDDAKGMRVRNLVSWTRFPAGKNTVYWDGYDFGTKVNERETTYDIQRKRVAPGKYVVYGLYHEGIKTFYQGSVYSPHTAKSTPWNNRQNANDLNSGGWIGEHGYPPTGLVFKPKGSGLPYGPDQDVMIICGHIGETNDLVAWVDMDFNKIHGTHSVNWTGKTGWASQECVPRNEVTRSGLKFVIDSKAHNVKVYKNDTLLRTIGKPGGLQIGLYDEQRMHNPVSIDVDSRGRLWVAERDEGPRRVSIWKITGEFVHAIYGPGHYGGGGIIDTRDSTRFYYARVPYNDGNLMQSSQLVMEFKIDWSSGQAKPYSILWRPDLSGMLKLHWSGPERSTYIGNRQYMFNTHPGFHRHSDASVGIWMMRSDRTLKGVAMIGLVAEIKENGAMVEHSFWPELDKPEIKAKLPSGVPLCEVIFTWSDINLNDKVEASEVQFKAFRTGKAHHRVQCSMDLSVVDASGLHFDPPKILDNGVPVYDLNTGKVLGDIQGANISKSPRAYVDQGEECVDGADGWLVFAGYPIQGFRHGVLRWRYDSQGAGPAPRFPGDITAATKLIGNPFTPDLGESGEVWALNGEFGDIHLLTTDGLYVCSFGGDIRTTPAWRMKTHSLGMEISNVSFSQECFYPGIVKLESGSVYLIAGHEHSSILDVKGLETVRRFEPVEFTVTEGDLSSIPAVNVPQSTIVAKIMYAGIWQHPPLVDGNLAEWDKDTSMFVSIDARTKGAIAVSGDKLYAAYKTADGKLLTNSGGQNGNFQTIFKTGGALDLFLASDSISTSRLTNSWRTRTEPARGDRRLIVTMVDNKPKAVLYIPVDPTASAQEKVTFTSGIASTTIDRIIDVSEDVTLAENNGNYEFSINLNKLGFQPNDIVDNLNTMGDIGILRGSQGQTVERIYWSNKNTLLVSDIPTEAKFQPNMWGLIRFKLQAQTASNSWPQTLPTKISVSSAGVLHISNAFYDNLEIRVLDAQGRIAGQKKLWPRGGTADVRFELSSGIYLYKILNGSNLMFSSKVFIDNNGK